MIRIPGALTAVPGAAALALTVLLQMPAPAHAAAAVTPKAPAASAPAASAGWVVPDINKLPDDAWGRTVRYGRDLTVRTASLMGPEVRDPAHRFAGNNLSCQDCHLEAGTKQFGLPYVGVYADFPSYRAREGAVGTIEERIQGCMVRSMNGRRLPPGSREMTAMVAYFKFLSTGRPVGEPTPGRGAGRMPELPRAADPARGKAVYTLRCAVCHGDHGQGRRAGVVGDAQGYAFPPLWGPDSFNDGAGMAHLIGAANFIHANMPVGTSWRAPALTTADAWDVTAYVDAQPRPHMAHRDRDFPNRLEKPVDTPYGPYADDIDPAQHRLGPFQPIRDALKTQKASGATHGNQNRP